MAPHTLFRDRKCVLCDQGARNGASDFLFDPLELSALNAISEALTGCFQLHRHDRTFYLVFPQVDLNTGRVTLLQSERRASIRDLHELLISLGTVLPHESELKRHGL